MNREILEGKVLKAFTCEVIVCKIRTGSGTPESPVRAQISVWTKDGRRIAVFNDVNTAPIKA